MKELKVKMHFYLTMNDGETEEEALQRTYDLLGTLSDCDNQKSAYQAYECEIIDFEEE